MWVEIYAFKGAVRKSTSYGYRRRSGFFASEKHISSSPSISQERGSDIRHARIPQVLFGFLDLHAQGRFMCPQNIRRIAKVHRA